VLVLAVLAPGLAFVGPASAGIARFVGIEISFNTSGDPYQFHQLLAI